MPCNQVQSLFQRNFVATGACDDVALVAWNREEQKPSTPGGFSPPPPSGAARAVLGSERRHVQRQERLRLDEHVQRRHGLRARLDGPRPARWIASPSCRRLSTSWGRSERDVRRAAGHRLRRAVVQQRHADRSHGQADPVAVRRQLRAQVHAGTRQPAVSNTQQAAKHDQNGGATMPRRFSLRCRNGPMPCRRSKSAFCAATAAQRDRPAKVTQTSGKVTLGVSSVLAYGPVPPSFQGIGARYDNCMVTSSDAYAVEFLEILGDQDDWIAQIFVGGGRRWTRAVAGRIASCACGTRQPDGLQILDPSGACASWAGAERPPLRRVTCDRRRPLRYAGRARSAAITANPSTPLSVSVAGRSRSRLPAPTRDCQRDDWAWSGSGAVADRPRRASPQTQNVNVSATTTFGVIATNAVGPSANKTVTVTVGAPPPPPPSGSIQCSGFAKTIVLDIPGRRTPQLIRRVSTDRRRWLAASPCRPA